MKVVFTLLLEGWMDWLQELNATGRMAGVPYVVLDVMLISVGAARIGMGDMEKMPRTLELAYTQCGIYTQARLQGRELFVAGCLSDLRSGVQTEQLYIAPLGTVLLMVVVVHTWSNEADETTTSLMPKDRAKIDTLGSRLV
eukprot:5373830-Amphidinium_carterae.1